MLRVRSYMKRFLHLPKHILKTRKVHSQARVFSGIQPTGVPHLGNYFGAIHKWVELQNAGKKCIFSIVDLHSITLPQEPHILKQNIHTMTACLLASGISPELSTIFLQSQVPQHAELSWVLSCLSTMAKLAHLPQYKEKSSSLKDIPLGIYIYPLLQCADILLYKTTEVPVGEDQTQHIQLAQHLARIFNNRFGQLFPIPTALTSPDSARIKSLRKPDKKMSKSDADSKSRIELTDSPDIVTEKMRKALTDFTSAVRYDPVNRPGISNVILIHSLCTGHSPEKICEENTHLDTGQYKLVVAEAVIELLKPIQNKISELLSEPSYIQNILERGSEKALAIAVETMNEVKESVGLSVNGNIGINPQLINRKFSVS